MNLIALFLRDVYELYNIINIKMKSYKRYIIFERWENNLIYFDI